MKNRSIVGKGTVPSRQYRRIVRETYAPVVELTSGAERVIMAKLGARGSDRIRPHDFEQGPPRSARSFFSSGTPALRSRPAAAPGVRGMCHANGVRAVSDRRGPARAAAWDGKGRCPERKKLERYGEALLESRASYSV